MHLGWSFLQTTFIVEARVSPSEFLSKVQLFYPDWDFLEVVPVRRSIEPVPLSNFLETVSRMKIIYPLFSPFLINSCSLQKITKNFALFSSRWYSLVIRRFSYKNFSEVNDLVMQAILKVIRYITIFKRYLWYFQWAASYQRCRMAVSACRRSWTPQWASREGWHRTTPPWLIITLIIVFTARILRCLCTPQVPLIITSMKKDHPRPELFTAPRTAILRHRRHPRRLPQRQMGLPQRLEQEIQVVATAIPLARNLRTVTSL